VWSATPASFHGEHYTFDDVYLEPKPYRPEGPRMWFGGIEISPFIIRRLVEHGHGFHPFGVPTADELALLRRTLSEAGRDPAEVEMVGGTRATFSDDHSCADLGAAMAPIAEQLEQGFTTFCVKPSQFIDSADELPAFLRDVMRRAEALGG
jgi:alkanesulfonate monooxygenase SsuD/methylene tetrahydromethanopterin reductase-like flavin-dependent oxidoreductase (luciferase family)